MDLSILIPARNEMFLKQTVDDLLKNIRGNTEILVGLDGAWANPTLVMDERVTILYYPISIGQRAMTNQLCRLSKAKYVMKVDAHCAFDEGFDVKMIAEMQDHWTMVPTMYNLHVFDWVCKKCGNKWYQGPTPTCCQSNYDGNIRNTNCDSTEFERKIVWQRRLNRKSNFYRFDKTLHFQYWGGFKERPEAQGDIAPSMSIQGSCFMLTRDKYWELDICDESHGSWGQQGTEVACKTWLSGGEVMINKKTWYAHLFRTQGGDFGFPYPNPGIEKAREFSRDLWLNNKWPKAKYPLEWLIKKFNPPEWDFTVGVIYYTDNNPATNILKICQEKIKAGAKHRKIISCSLKPLDFGENIHLPLERGYLTMFKQILTALEKLDTDIVFFCEHDVLYHPSHFEFIPAKRDVCYYNVNVWKMGLDNRKAFKVDECKQTSGLCGYRETLLAHYRKRVELVEKNGYSVKMGFEPGTHRRNERVDDLTSEAWSSKYPNVDIRHNSNLTPSRFSKDEFRDQRYTKGWTEQDSIPGWGKVEEIILEINGA